MTANNPYAFDPRPPEKIDPGKWIRFGRQSNECPECRSTIHEFMDSCVDAGTGKTQIMLQCQKCRHVFYVLLRGGR